MNSWLNSEIYAFFRENGTVFLFAEFCKRILQLSEDKKSNFTQISIELDLVSAMIDCKNNPIDFHIAQSRCNDFPALNLTTLQDLFNFLIPIQQKAFAKSLFPNIKFNTLTERECFNLLIKNPSLTDITNHSVPNKSTYYSNNLFILSSGTDESFLVTEQSIKNLESHGVLSVGYSKSVLSKDEKAILKYKVSILND